jgi:putative membrane protein insertion efficiency factor
VTRQSATRRRRLLLGLLIGGLVLLAADLARPPAKQLSARAMLVGIDLYQATLSPRLAAAGAQCRFQPTCSHYGEAVIRRHGALVGSGKAMWRILRCGPWTSADTVDPPD